MIHDTLKRAAKKMLGLSGSQGEVPAAPAIEARASRLGVLRQASKIGFRPGAIIDVGAAYGQFSLDCQRIFPGTRGVLVEALEEYRPHLEAAARQLPGAEVVFAAATSQLGEIVINVHPDLVGSSVYREREGAHVNGTPRTVRTVTLDHLKASTGIQGPFLLKVDVQGAELDVLSGAEQTLTATDFVLLEVSLFGFFEGGPLFHEIVAFMKQRGFVAYDLYGLLYRPLDGALAQVDIVFVKEDGPFREQQGYATREQRAELNRRFQAEASRPAAG